MLNKRTGIGRLSRRAAGQDRRIRLDNHAFADRGLHRQRDLGKPFGVAEIAAITTTNSPTRPNPPNSCVRRFTRQPDLLS